MKGAVAGETLRFRPGLRYDERMQRSRGGLTRSTTTAALKSAVNAVLASTLPNNYESSPSHSNGVTYPEALYRQGGRWGAMGWGLLASLYGQGKDWWLLGLVALAVLLKMSMRTVQRIVAHLHQLDVLETKDGALKPGRQQACRLRRPPGPNRYARGTCLLYTSPSPRD